MFQGTYTAIITPFLDGKVDEKKLEQLVELQIDAGVQGIVPCGSTGESICLSQDEHRQIIETCVRLCRGRIQVIPGAGSPTTEGAIALVKQAEKAGADGALVITPWYIRPSQEALFHHYQTIRNQTGLPVILYNNPARTAVEISADTLVRLVEEDIIQGYKESGTCMPRISHLRSVLGNKVSLLAGNDDYTAAFLGMGADGGIFVTSNAVPYLFVDLVKTWGAGDISLFQQKWLDIFPLIRAIFSDTNPFPIRYVMHLLHGVSLETRLPFVSLAETTKTAIEKALEGLGLWPSLSVVRER